MGVEAVSSAATATATATTQSNSTQSANAASLDYDTFLKLLIAQMQNQDPTEPMDSTEQIAQLATFSQVEQTIETNRNLEALIQSSSIDQASSVVGKSISNLEGTISGTVQEVRITSDGVEAVLENGEQISVGPGMIIHNSNNS
jgi:flagellar basal-body rod modification protein FlgD